MTLRSDIEFLHRELENLRDTASEAAGNVLDALTALDERNYARARGALEDIPGMLRGPTSAEDIIHMTDQARSEIEERGVA